MSTKTDGERDMQQEDPVTPDPQAEGGEPAADRDTPGFVDRRSPYKPKFKPLWKNFITYVSTYSAAMAVMLLGTFSLYSMVTPAANAYVDIVGYLVLPILLILSVLGIPFGILFKSWRLRRRDPEQMLAFRFPRIDLNDPIQRKAAKFMFVGMLIGLPVVGVSGYHGYHYTDSTNFCADACHKVMAPQGVANGLSPHARVACAECHIGAGAGWFVKSKLSGTRQVVAMWRESYSRPIPPAIHNLRPARETCERCHWPEKNFGAQLRELAHYGCDEKNTRRQINMLLKTGGADRATGDVHGIHWHVAAANKVEYIATDEELQVIPWVKTVDRQGRQLIYRSDGKPISDPAPEGALRRLDCMDCHNRIGHAFLSPHEAIDVMLEAGRVDRTLPYIKREAVRAMSAEYTDLEHAEREIGGALSVFYETTYPEIWNAPTRPVHRAIDVIREVYRENMFAYMKVDWRTYPSNTGHRHSAGCFRCHSKKHVNQFGDTLAPDCHTCHTFLNWVPRDGDETYITEGEFVHPFEINGVHDELQCHQCHTGAVGPLPTCNGCHVDEVAFASGETKAFAEFAIAPDPMFGAVDCESCHDISGPRDIEKINEACLDCHDDDEDRFDGMVASWKTEVEAMFIDAADKVDARGAKLLQRLRDSGPYHNMEATRAILKKLANPPLVTAPAEADAEPEAEGDGHAG